ncbi:hypothetical protein P3G66_31945, partial [Rhodococcus sp. C3V]|nr:hypothetical protein [Rhodococcus sp. C3V]
TVTGGVATLSHAFDVAGAQSVTADFTAGAGFVSSSAPAQTVTVSVMKLTGDDVQYHASGIDPGVGAHHANTQQANTQQAMGGAL